MTRDDYLKMQSMGKNISKIMNAISEKFNNRIVNDEIFISVMEYNGEIVYFINFELINPYQYIRGYYKSINEIESKLWVKINL